MERGDLIGVNLALSTFTFSLFSLLQLSWIRYLLHARKYSRCFLCGFLELIPLSSPHSSLSVGCCSVSSEPDQGPLRHAASLHLFLLPPTALAAFRLLSKAQTGVCDCPDQASCCPRINSGPHLLPLSLLNPTPSHTEW